MVLMNNNSFLIIHFLLNPIPYNYRSTIGMGIYIDISKLCGVKLQNTDNILYYT